MAMAAVSASGGGGDGGGGGDDGWWKNHLAERMREMRRKMSSKEEGKKKKEKREGIPIPIPTSAEEKKLLIPFTDEFKKELEERAKRAAPLTEGERKRGEEVARRCAEKRRIHRQRSEIDDGKQLLEGEKMKGEDEKNKIKKPLTPEDLERIPCKWRLQVKLARASEMAPELRAKMRERAIAEYSHELARASERAFDKWMEEVEDSRKPPSSPPRSSFDDNPYHDNEDFNCGCPGRGDKKKNKDGDDVDDESNG